MSGWLSSRQAMGTNSSDWNLIRQDLANSGRFRLPQTPVHHAQRRPHARHLHQVPAAAPEPPYGSWPAAKENLSGAWVWGMAFCLNNAKAGKSGQATVVPAHLHSATIESSKLRESQLAQAEGKVSPSRAPCGLWAVRRIAGVACPQGCGQPATYSTG